MINVSYFHTLCYFRMTYGSFHVQHWSYDYELALTSQSYFYVRLLLQENIAEDAGNEN